MILIETKEENQTLWSMCYRLGSPEADAELEFGMQALY